MKTFRKALVTLGAAAALILGTVACQNPQADTQSALADANSASPIVVIALAKVAPDNEDLFRQAAEKILMPTRGEKGNISYDFQESSTDATQFATYEQWESQAAIDAHMKSPHMTEFFNAVGTLFAPGYPQIVEYTKLAPQ